MFYNFEIKLIDFTIDSYESYSIVIIFYLQGTGYDNKN